MIYHIKSEIQYNKKSFERRKPSLFSRISAIFCLNIFEESFLLQTLEHQSTIQLNFRCNFKSDSDFRSILSSIIHVWLVTWSSMPDHDPTDLLPYLNSIPSTCGYSNSWIWFVLQSSWLETWLDLRPQNWIKSIFLINTLLIHCPILFNKI